MRFLIVRQADHSALIEDYPAIRHAEMAAGLSPGHLDFGMFGRDMGYCVFEFGLFEPESIGYCAIYKTLIAGNAVLFRVNPDNGETVDWHEDFGGASVPPIRFFGSSQAEVERGISRGLVERPVMAVNGEVLWRWPESRSL